MKKEVDEFLSQIGNVRKREDSKTLVKIMEEESGHPVSLRGRILSFGVYQYRYESGREGEAIVTGFSPRAQYIAIYIMPGFSTFGKELEKLGKHRLAKVCIYINRLSDVDEKILRTIIRRSVAQMSKKYECRPE